MTTDLDFKIQIPKTRTAQNETEPLKLVVKLADKNENTSLEQTLYSTSEKIEKITFREIKIGSEVKISANIYDSGILLYTGETEYKKVEPTNNVFSLTLKKVNTEDIIDAKVPEIIIQPENKTKNTSEETQEPFEHTLHISAQSNDGGIISFQWQTKKDNGEWENIDETNSTQAENLYSSILSVTIPLNTVKYYRCIVTNTNENVNGEKTASITSNEVSVSYLKGELTEITATYNSTGYEIFGSEFSDLETNPNKISIEETYTTSNNDKIEIFANAQNYSIQKSTEVENAIGYVPYTVTYNGGTTSGASISNTMYVPVKYELSADSLSISGTPNETATWGTESNPEKVAQHTGSSTLTAKYSSNISLYSKDSSEVADFNILDNCSISWSTGTKKADNSVTVDNSIAGNFTYTATLTSNSEWIVGEEISTEYYITVCPWEIALTPEDGGDSVDPNNLSENTNYILSVTNSALTANPYTPEWNVTEQSEFSIDSNSNQLSTPVAGENAQTATITATVGETEVASIKVTVAGIEYGTKTNPITDWSRLARKIVNTGGDIYISGEMTATEKITVEKETNIIAANPVTITRDTSFTDTMFTVNETFTMQGTSEKTIIIDGNNINATNTIISSNNISLSYVTIQNCNSSEILGTAISVNNGTFSLQNSILKENSFTYSSIIFDGNSINAEINDCSFEDSIQDLQIYDANSVSISNTSFNRDNCDNIVITKCSELALGKNILIPNIFYQNFATSELNIICSDITLKNIDTPITIELSYYTGEYDLNLFVLQNGETVPENIFTLADENYVIGSDGSVEKVSSGDTYSQGDTYIESISINDKSFDYTKMIVVLDKSTTITGNETYYSSYYTSGDSSSDPETYKGCFYEDQSIDLQPFVLGQYEVTQELFTTIMGTEHKYTFEAENYPAHDLNWYMAIAFCNKLSLNQQIEPYYTVKDSQGNTIDFETLEYSSIPTSSENTWTVTENNNSGYRLPTEMEWEFAARGGDPDSDVWKYAFPGTDNSDKTKSINNIKGDSNLDNYAYYDDSESANVNEDTTYEVGQKQPNTLSLYDMAGNVREWCNNEYYNESYKSYRGGSYYDYAYQCCVSYRSRELPHVTNSGSSSNAKYGFRLCRTITN